MNLDGATLKPLLRYGDLENKISIGTAGAFLARDLFKESTPYYREYAEDGTLIPRPTYHFLRELRRQLSGDAEEGTSTYSPKEILFFNKYIAHVNETEVFTGEDLLALQELDKWIIDELTNTPHEQINREYSPTHKWAKILKRETPWP